MTPGELKDWLELFLLAYLMFVGLILCPIAWVWLVFRERRKGKKP